MIVIYYQNRETKKTYIRESFYDNPIHVLKDFRGLWDNKYYSWLGVK